MKRFICEVERIDKYIVEIDETKFDKEAMERFKEYFYDFDTYEEHAEHIAQHRARFKERFIEGYDIPLVNGEVPWGVDGNDAINITIIEEDEVCSVSVMEIEDHEES